jgi:hypothetical protein
MYKMDLESGIRGFSKPVFRVDLVPIYLDTLKQLCIPDWKMIRERLYTKEADQIIVAMVEYKDVFVAREAAEKKWYSLKKSYPLDSAAEEMYQVVLQKRQEDKESYKALCELLQKPPYDHDDDWALTIKIE